MKRKIGEPFGGGAGENSALFQIAEIIRKAGMIDHPSDSVLAHITPKEASVLKKHGGAGKRNKRTGALSFYEEGNEGNESDSRGGSDRAESGNSGESDESDDSADSMDAGDMDTGFGGVSYGESYGPSMSDFTGGTATEDEGEQYGPSMADFGEQYGPSMADFGEQYGPSMAELTGEPTEALSGRDAYGPRAGPGGIPSSGSVYAGYNPSEPTFAETYGPSILGAVGGFLGGPLGGIAGYAVGREVFGRPETGSRISSGYSQADMDEASAAIDSSAGVRGVNTPSHASSYFNGQEVDNSSSGAQQIVQSLPTTVVQPVAPVPPPLPWRTYQPPKIDWARYGEGAGTSFYDRVNPLANSYARGGAVPREPASAPPGGSLMGLIDGPGDGESDSIPVRMPNGEGGALSGGEYIIPAVDVAAFGNGSSLAGARTLDGILMSVRRSHIDNLARKPPPRR